jgi:hypothetical protein
MTIDCQTASSLLPNREVIELEANRPKLFSPQPLKICRKLALDQFFQERGRFS